MRVCRIIYLLNCEIKMILLLDPRVVVWRTIIEMHVKDQLDQALKTYASPRMVLFYCSFYLLFVVVYILINMPLIGIPYC